jgi:TAT (twin-arginine translocation) pathway signal sequence
MDDSKSLSESVGPAQPSRRRLLKTASLAAGGAVILGGLQTK